MKYLMSSQNIKIPTKLRILLLLCNTLPNSILGAFWNSFQSVAVLNCSAPELDSN